ncbi:MAG TPA: tyrosine-type recombinase/integrase [Gaiellales bacterium]|nr:tyrosine-type recombinase/integrase [Gaiellales bacterium]
MSLARRHSQPPTLEELITPDERTYQASILEMLGVFGWRAVHHHPLRTKAGWRTGIEGPGCAGFPDIIAVRETPDLRGRHRLLAAELKSERGRLAPAQAEWLRLLATAGAEAHVWVAGGDSLRIAEVKAKRAAFETDVARGEWRDQSRLTFSAYAEDWVDTFAGRTARGIRPETRADYKRNLERNGTKFFGRMRLAEIEPRDIRRFVAAMQARGVSANTVRLAVAPVRALLATAVEDGVIRSNPCAGIRLSSSRVDPDEDAGGARALTHEEYTKLLAKLPDEWRLLIRTLGETGLRIGELLALTWSDVDLGTRRVHVRRRVYRGKLGPPKSRYGRRSVPVTRDLAQSLWQARGASRYALDADPVFASSTGTRLDPGNLHARVLKPAARTAGVDWAGFHTLRHTCATELFRRGLNAKQAQVWLGHHSPAFTMATYVHLLSDELPDSPFDTAGGNQVGTRPAEARRDETAEAEAETA